MPFTATFYLYIHCGVESAKFIRLLRPELVKNNKKTLSSDNFTPFQARANTQQDEEEVAQVARNLREKVIPKFYSDLVHKQLQLNCSSKPVHQMHKRGINLRFLGTIWRILIKNDARHMAALAILEMIT